MKKHNKNYKKNYENRIKNGFKNLNFNFVTIHIIRKMLVLLKNYLDYLKDNNSECFFSKLLFFLKNYFFHNI